MRTTVTLHPITIDYLTDLSDRALINRSYLLRLCLFKWFKAKRKGVRFSNKSVSYQLPDGIAYKRVHVVFSSFEYESYIDSRKLLKRSVSSIAAEAIYQYAEKICCNLSDAFIDLDTYVFPKYKVIRINEHSHIKWELYWFPPVNHDKKMKYPLQ